MEDETREEELFQLIKGVLTSGGPVLMIVFLREVKEGAGDSGVVGNESTVKVGEAKEGSYILDFNGGWPGGDAIKLDRINGELTGFYDHS